MSFAQPVSQQPFWTDFMIFLLGLLLLAFSYYLLQYHYKVLPLADTVIVAAPAQSSGELKASNIVSFPLTVKTGVSMGVLEQSVGQAFLKEGNEIPDETRLLGIIASNGIVTVNLSREFTEGGGSHSMIGRVQNIKDAVQAVNPTLEMKIQIEGKPLKVLGGEGLEIE